MFAVVILFTMGTGLLALGLNSRIFSIRSASAIKARTAADAGLTRAMFEMNEQLRLKKLNKHILPHAAETDLPNCDATFSYTVMPDISGSGYIIESTGESGKATKMVYTTIELQGVFESAILTKQGLILKSGTVVDGYNSMDPLDDDIDVDIGTQSTLNDSVVLNMGVVVNGDVFAGTGSDLDAVIKDLGATTGDRYTAAPRPLPQVTAPALPVMGAIEATGQTVTIAPADSGTYAEIYLRQLVVYKSGKTSGKVIDKIPAVLEVGGGDVVLHVTGDIQLENSCDIVIKDGSTLTIYIDGNIHCRLGSSINTENPPEKAETLQIYATGQDTQFFDIKAKSDFTGVIYAPNADVDLYAQGDVYGSIVADSFEFKAGGNYYYDEALKEVSANDYDKGVRFVIKRWHEGSPTSSILVPIEVEEPEVEEPEV
jgi:hypothetical protein